MDVAVDCVGQRDARVLCSVVREPSGQKLGIFPYDEHDPEKRYRIFESLNIGSRHLSDYTREARWG